MWSASDPSDPFLRSLGSERGRAGFMVIHFIKSLADLPPAIARELIKRGIAESVDEMDNVQPLSDRMVRKGERVGTDDDR